MAKYHRWNPDNKKAGRKKVRSKLGLTSRLHNIINKDEKNNEKIRTLKISTWAMRTFLLTLLIAEEFILPPTVSILQLLPF